MKKVFKKYKQKLLIVLSLVIIGSIPFSYNYPLDGQDVGSISAQMSQINDQINSLQSEVTSNQSQLSTLLSQKNNIQGNLYTIQGLLDQATQKENAINALITSLGVLQNQAETTLAKKIALRNASFETLYISSNDNLLFDFMSSNDAQSFLYKAALNESVLSSQKQELIDLAKEINDLQLSLNTENKEKATQDAQVKQLATQKAQLQSELYYVQSNYNSTNSKIANDQGQISNLNSQYGQLSAQENAILAAKLNSSQYQYVSTIPSNCPGAVGTNGNLPLGGSGTFSIAVNKKVLASNVNSVIDIVPTSVNSISGITPASNSIKSRGCYTGTIEFRSDTDASFINQNSMENYVQGIGEMPSDWQQQALDAQAVAARTYALYCKNHGNPTCSQKNESSNHYDLNDTTQYQSYDGYQGGSKVQAGLDTLANVIYYGGTGTQNIIDSFFSANNGGYERSNTQVWGTPQYSYLPSQSDSYGSVQYNNYPDPNNMCPAEYYGPAGPSSPNGTLGVLQLNNGVGSLYDILGIAIELNKGTSAASINTNNDYSSTLTNTVGTFTGAIFNYDNGRSSNSSMPDSQQEGIVNSSSGNTEGVKSVTINGTSGSVTVGYYSSTNISDVQEAYNLTSPLKDVLYTPLWYFTYNGGSTAQFFGFGFGHTIGMSQCGAEGRAAAGQNYSQILQFYYTSGSQILADPQIASTNPESCNSITNYSNNDACIRVGIDGYSGNDNMVTESDSYKIYINGSVVYQGNSGDSIEIQQNF